LIVPGYGVSPSRHRSPANAGTFHPAGNAIDRAINLGAINATASPYGRGSVLPRKEVIQPHLPVRLPCYDFVPITDPTFDGCLPCGLAHRLRVLPAFMT
jgi:hypothetical protein